MVARRLPRRFEFHWGRGLVTEEACVATPYHEPTIQLLVYDSGERAIRFCGYEHGKMGRYPLVVSEEHLEALGREVRRNRDLHRLLRKIVG